MKTRVAVALLLSAFAAQIYSTDAAATVVNVDEVAVVRDGTTIFDDSFDRNITLNGGSGTSLPSGTTFSDGTPANYFVQGSIPETTANNGQAQWNTANGILVHQAPPSIPLIQVVNAGPITGTAARLDTEEHLLGGGLVRCCGALCSIGDIPVVHRQ